MRRVFHLVWVVAIVFAALHVMLVAAPVFVSRGGGEAQAFAVVAFDFPLFWLLRQFQWGRDLLTGNLGATGQEMYILLFGIGGTIFWAAVGALLGYLIGLLVLLVRRRANAT